MRHRIAGRKLNRNSAERNSLFRNLMISLVQYEKIQTTEAKAKEIQAQIEKLITTSRVDSYHNRGQVLAALDNTLAVAKLFELIGPRYVDRDGGYTRIHKLGLRRGDAAQMVQIELVD